MTSPESRIPNPYLHPSAPFPALLPGPAS